MIQALYQKHKKELSFNLRTMGVINITPNSFSDADSLLTLTKTKEKLLKKIKEFDIVDIGAESTAPFNKAVSFDEEMRRFEYFFIPLLKDIGDPKTTISIDTYKIEVFEYVCKKINNSWPKTKVIFNDISGCIDDKLLCLLSSSLKFDYIFSHNLCLKREDSSNHMNYTRKNLAICDINSFFNEMKNKTKRKVYFDPCFGFSKTKKQNLMILNNLDKLDVENLVVGISRKSFLRFDNKLSVKEDLDLLEQIQSNILSLIFKSNKKNLIVRTHSIKPLESAVLTTSLL
ncbi:MAG: dihydropteroate synthase [Bacteriovoracaceae bacterium]|jgi:dihydropteroate synthase|nr:dihydropteroate synthase [Bacteriovoracaceae bacterium]